MSEIQEKARALQRFSSFVAYDGPGQDRASQVELARLRSVAQDNLNAYQEGYRNIRAWHPISFEQFQSASSKNQNRPSLLSARVDEKPSPQKSMVAENHPSPPIYETKPSPAQNALDNVDREISQTLLEWSEAMLSNNFERVASCYARHVDRDFLKLDINNDAVSS